MGHYYLPWMPSTFIHRRGILTRQERRIWEMKSSSKHGFSSLLIIPSFFFLLSISKVGLGRGKPAGVLGITHTRYRLPPVSLTFFKHTRGAGILMFALGWLFPGLPSLWLLLFLGFKDVNEESVATFSSWSRNNGFSKGCHGGGGLEGGSSGFRGARRVQPRTPSCFVQRSLASTQETLSSELLHSFHLKGGEKSIGSIPQMQVARKPACPLHGSLC